MTKTTQVQVTMQKDIMDTTTQDRGNLRVSRQNQQLILYIFITLVISLAWILGTLEVSFLWTFALIVLTFVVWTAKVIHLTEDHIRHEEAVVHRKRALKGHCETSEWLNFLINRWWVFSSGSIEDLVKKHLNPLLLTLRPKFIESIVLKTFTFGDTTPFLKYVKVFEQGLNSTEGVPGKTGASWQNIVRPPQGLPQLGQYSVVLEGDVSLQCEEFKMLFSCRLGGKWMGLSVDVVVEKLHLDGNMQMTLNMNSDAAFPHVANCVIAFQDTPEVWFSVRVLKAFQVMEVPVLKTWIHSLVMDALTQALVDPAKLEFQVASHGPGTLLPAKNKSKKLAEGVVTVSVSGESSKGGVFTDDIRYCSLTLCDQKEHTKQSQGPQKWQDTCSFLVHDLKQDRLTVKCKSKRMFTTYTLAQFDLDLANYPFEHQNSVEEHFEKKISKWESGGTLTIDLHLEYSPLPQVDLMKEELEDSMQAVQEVAGVMYICVHSAKNLLALDRTGTSDPYCIIFNNGHKVKTTHYICSTRNPEWETSVEFLVGDFTKSVLSFIVYDWDGHDASESDFLGSAFCVLSHEEPCAVNRCLTLGYLMHTEQVEAKLGSITISAIFRPVSSVARAELKRLNAGQETQQDKNRNIISKMNGESDSVFDEDLKELKKPSSSSIGDMLLGHGIMELNLVRGKNLVAKDSNGFSDPFCEVKVGNDRKFTSSIKRKTLNPVWDEWVTLQLPGPGEELEIVVWDKDPLFKKDFLGCLNFTLDELKKYSSDKDNQWFKLQRITSGEIELRLQVMTDDVCNSRTNSPAPESAPASASSNTVRKSESRSFPDELPTVQVNGIEVNLTDAESTHTATAPDTGSSDRSPHSLGSRSQSPTIRSSFRNRFRKLSGQKSAPTSLSRAPSGDVGPHYFDVVGTLLGARGLSNNAGKIYTKIRLDNRDRKLQLKKPSQGHVLAKSRTIDVQDEVAFSLMFDVDKQVGVLQEAMLIIDIKHSHKKHVATKGFHLHNIFGDATEVTKWLQLDHRVEVELTMSRR